MSQASATVDLESLRELVNVRLTQLVPDGHPRGPAAAARHSLLAGGKRLRAIITLVAARSFGGQIEDMDEDAKDAFIESAKQEFDKYIDIRAQASTMQVDELLPAGDLRKQLERRLDTYCGNKVREERPAEELYDLNSDPHETRNLVHSSDRSHQMALARLRTILHRWIVETGDQGRFPETDAALEAVLQRWGDKAVNKEYDRVRSEKQK